MKALFMFKTTGGKIGSKLARRKAGREASSPDQSTATGCPRRSGKSLKNCSGGNRDDIQGDQEEWKRRVGYYYESR